MSASHPFCLVVDGEVTRAEETMRAVQLARAESQIVMTMGEAYAVMRRRTPDLVLIADELPDGRGIDFIADGEVASSGVPVVLVAEAASTAEIVEAVKRGAADVTDRPVLSAQIQRLLKSRSEKPSKDKETAAVDSVARPPIIGKSQAISAVVDALRLVTQAPKATVLIEGESGTGKELIARAVHFDSPRRAGPFMAVNCATLNENLLEAELFGHEKGAFTGALANGKKGLFEAAAGGTLFLDEIGELAPGMQAKLLRVLQEGCFKKVGGVADIRTDVRIIAATNRDLRTEVRDGRFRADLFYRLNVVPVRVPPLRDRRDDIPELCRHFLGKFAVDLGKTIDGISPRALERLIGYDWPGNIRELRNVCEYAAIVCDTNFVEPRHLTIPDGSTAEKSLRDPSPVADTQDDGPRDLSLRGMESELIRTVLNETHFNISRAAQTLGINRSTLYNKMRDLGMHPARPKARQSV
jgi:DNA-binding NtrC family response regulator